MIMILIMLLPSPTKITFDKLKFGFCCCIQLHIFLNAHQLRSPYSAKIKYFNEEMKILDLGKPSKKKKKYGIFHTWV